MTRFTPSRSRSKSWQPNDANLTMKGPVLAAVALSAAAVVLVLSMPRPVLSHETVTTWALLDREILMVLTPPCVMFHVEGAPSFPLAAYEEVWLQKRKGSAAVLG